MKVAIFSDSFLPYICGVTTSIINQANELTRRGHQVEIYRPKPAAGADKSLGSLDERITVHDLPISVASDKFPDLNFAIPTALVSYSKVRDFQPDIFHTHTEWGCGWEGMILSRVFRKPLVSTFNTFYADPGYLEHFKIPVPTLAREVIWRYLMGFYNRCDAIISPSQSALDELAVRKLRARPFLIANGVEDPVFRTDEEVAGLREELGLSSGPNFIYVGRVAQEKSLEVVVQAFKRVAESHSGPRLVLVGDGPHRAALSAEIERLELGERVVDLGMVPHDQLIRRNVLRAADVFVTASKTENHPLSLLEALIFGLPVVGPRARGIPELITDRETGFLFEPDNVAEVASIMETLINEPATLQRLSENARVDGRRFLVSSVAEQLETVYQAVQADRLEDA